MSDISNIVDNASNLADEAASISDRAVTLAQEVLNLQAVAEKASYTPVIVNGVDPFIFAITVFTLACFIGYFVVWRVTPALHTPLMSVTNAISSIIIIGAILAASSELVSSKLGLFAVFIASINIFGGFIVTQRMLHMFKDKKGSK